jgi:hypothetical protein
MAVGKPRDSDRYALKTWPHGGGAGAFAWLVWRPSSRLLDHGFVLSSHHILFDRHAKLG